MIIARSKFLQTPFTSKVGKALALRYGINLALQLHILDLIAKFDNQTVIRLLQNFLIPSTSLRLICEDIQHLSTFFELFSVSYTRRNCNKVCHNLSKSACDIKSNSVGHDTLPLQVLLLIESKVASLFVSMKRSLFALKK